MIGAPATLRLVGLEAHHRHSPHRNHRPGPPTTQNSLKTQDNCRSSSHRGSLVHNRDRLVTRGRRRREVRGAVVAPGNESRTPAAAVVGQTVMAHRIPVANHDADPHPGHRVLPPSASWTLPA